VPKRILKLFGIGGKKNPASSATRQQRRAAERKAGFEKVEHDSEGKPKAQLPPRGERRKEIKRK